MAQEAPPEGEDDEEELIETVEPTESPPATKPLDPDDPDIPASAKLSLRIRLIAAHLLRLFGGAKQ
jgi:hypothetical protein